MSLLTKCLTSKVLFCNNLFCVLKILFIMVRKLLLRFMLSSTKMIQHPANMLSKLGSAWWISCFSYFPLNTHKISYIKMSVFRSMGDWVVTSKKLEKSICIYYLQLRPLFDISNSSLGVPRCAWTTARVNGGTGMMIAPTCFASLSAGLRDYAFWKDKGDRKQLFWHI